RAEGVQHADPYVRVLLQPVIGLGQLAEHLLADAVQLRHAVQPDQQDVAALLDDDTAVGISVGHDQAVGTVGWFSSSAALAMAPRYSGAGGGQRWAVDSTSWSPPPPGPADQMSRHTLASPSRLRELWAPTLRSSGSRPAATIEGRRKLAFTPLIAGV